MTAYLGEGELHLLLLRHVLVERDRDEEEHDAQIDGATYHALRLRAARSKVNSQGSRFQEGIQRETDNWKPNSSFTPCLPPTSKVKIKQRTEGRGQQTLTNRRQGSRKVVREDPHEKAYLTLDWIPVNVKPVELQSLCPRFLLLATSRTAVSDSALCLALFRLSPLCLSVAPSFSRTHTQGREGERKG